LYASGIFGDSIFKNSAPTRNYTPLSQYKVTTGKANTVAAGDNLVIGNNRNDPPNSFWNGDIAEVIVYNTLLDSATRRQVEDYLYHKYAPPVNLGPDIVMPNLCDTVLRAIIPGSTYFVSFVWNGDTTDTLSSSYTVTGPGTYTVVATDIFGFTSTDTVTVTYPLSHLSAHDTLCYGNTVVLSTGLSSPYTFAWSNGETTASISVTATGAYSVTVTDVTGCTMVSDTDSVFVDNFSQIIDLGADSNVLCVGNLLSLTSGANLVASYLWNDNSTASTLAVSVTGWYSVTVTDSLHNCTATDSTYITIAGTAPVADFNFTTACLGDVIQFIDLSTATAPDIVSTWFWTFGDTASGSNDTSYIQFPTHLYSDTLSHIVTLRVTTNGGCFGITTDTVHAFPYPVPGFTYSGTCTNNPAVFINTSNVFGDTAATWLWNFGDPSSGNNTDTLQNTSHIYVNLGSYTVKLIVTTSAGCKDSIQQVITVNPPNYCFTPAQIPGLQVWLAGDSIVQDSAHVGYVSRWMDKSGLYHNFSSTSDTSKQPLFIANNPVLAGNPSLKFDGVNDEFLSDTTCDVGTVFVLSDWEGVDSFPEWNGLLNRDIFASPCYIFSGNPNQAPFPSTALYTGYRTLYGSNIYINSLPGTYYMPIHDYKVVTGAIPDSVVRNWKLIVGNNRVDPLSFWNGNIAEVIVYNTILTSLQRNDVLQYLYRKYAPPANLGPDITASSICPITITPGYWFKTYIWQGDTALHTPVLTVVRSGQYVVECIDIFGRHSYDTVNVSFPVNELPHLNNLCAGNTLTWSTLLDTSFQFQWMGLPDTTPSIDITTEGYYAFSVTDDSLGCTFISDTVFVDVDSLPLVASIASDTDTTLCSGNTIRLIAGENIATYLWSNGTTDTAMVVSTSGLYWVQVTDSLGCQGYDTVNVIIGGTAPTAVLDYSATCEGDYMQFSGLSSVPNSGSIDSLIWNFGDTASGPNNTSIGWQPLHLYSDTAPHLVTLTVFTDSGCQNYTTRLVQVVPKPQVNFTSSNACAGTAVNFFDATTFIGDTPGNYIWDFGDPASGSANSAFTATTTHVYNTDGSYFVKLFAFSTLGCYDSTIKEVDVHKTIIPTFSNSSTCFGSIMSFFGIANTGTETVNWHWNFGDGGTSILWPNPSHFYAAAGNYFVSVTATTSNNCIATAFRNVTVNPKPVANFDTSSACLGAPYTFTPTSTISSGSIACNDWDIIGVAQFTCNPSPSYTFNTLATYNVKLTVTSDANCVSTVTKPITVRPLPIPGFNFTPNFGPPPLPVFFSNTSQNVSSNTYTWNFGDGGTSTLTGPQHTFADTGNYCIRLTAISQYGCKDSTTNCIYVIKPRLDVAVRDIWATAADNTLSVSARISNYGTLNVDRILMKASFPDGTSIQEMDDAGLLAGATDTFYFAAALTIPVTSNHDYYCVEAILPNGLVDEVPANNKRCEAIVDDFSIVDPYPNPFSGSVNLDVVLPYDDHLTIELFDALGQKMETLYDGMAYVGLNSINADLSSLAEGMYAVRFTFRDNTKVREVMKVSRKK
jgi:PKD repeat protein